MCFQIEIDTGLGGHAAADVAAAIRARTGLHVARRQGVLSLSQETGCACSMLAEGADWDAPAWDLRPDGLRALEAAVDLIASRSPRGCRFRAYWLGEEPQQTLRVPVEHLTADIRANQVRNKVTYEFGPRAA